jgi:hypothetical protein
MPLSSITELALRSAVNTNSRDISSTSATSQADAIKGVATQMAQSQSSMSSGSQATSAITAAVAVLTVAYGAISSHMSTLKDKRLSYDKMRAAGVADFFLPKNKEESELTTEEKVIQGFIQLAKTYPSLEKYLGIHSSVLSEGEQGIYYSVLPFYRMSEALGQSNSSSGPLDVQRAAIRLYFASSFPDAIAEIDTRFQRDNRLAAFFKSLYQGCNYLNDRRAPRFIMMCLANLLWNLEHPVEVESGFPMARSKLVEINQCAVMFINQLLDKTSPPYLLAISNGENELVSVVLKMEMYIKRLKFAYGEEQLHGLNIDDITNSAHHALRIMDTRMLQLIFKRFNEVTQKEEPDDKAAGCMADMISAITTLLQMNPNLLRLLPVPLSLESDSRINKPPMTTIDILIIFCHLSGKERKQVIADLSISPIGSVQLFAKELNTLHRKFIKPINDVSKKELGASWHTSKYGEVGKLTARRLIPFMTLLIEDYNLEVDTQDTYSRAKNWQHGSLDKRLLSGKSQVHDINLSAQKGDGFYKWALSPFTGGATELDELPKCQYRLTQVTKLMDSVSDLVKNYRSFLLKRSFQKFLMKCLEKVKAEMAELEGFITGAGDKLSLYEATNTESASDSGAVTHKDSMGRVVLSRSLVGILNPMTQELNANLIAFDLAMTSFEHVVSAPDFIDQQHELLTSKVSGIASQFLSLFGEDSGLLSLIEQNSSIETPSSKSMVASPRLPTSPLSENYVKDSTKNTLKHLIKNCHNALSWQSKTGHKGLLLSELSSMVDDRKHFTEKDIAHVVKELTRITASARDNWFFTASYGQTKSAKIVCQAIKNQDINREIPLASILFDQPDINIASLTDAMIQKQLNKLRLADHRWSEPSHDMRVQWLGSSTAPHVDASNAVFL